MVPQEARKKIQSPKLGELFEAVLKSGEESEFYCNKRFTSLEDNETSFSDITFDGCVFERIDFSSVTFKDIDCIDVIFRQCDLSNQVFDKRLLSRVQFDRCKLVGTSFVQSSLKDLSFQETNAMYANFAKAKISYMEIIESDFSFVTFLETQLKHFFLSQVKFVGSEFYQTPLKGVNLSGCDIKEARFDSSSIRGAKVHFLQCQDLVSMLGVEVVSE